MSFEATAGRDGASADFLARGSSYQVQTNSAGATLWLRHSVHSEVTGDVLASDAARSRTTAYSALEMRLVGADRTVRPVGQEQLAGRVNYFIGNDPAKWATNIPTFTKVRYAGVYPGIDVVYYGNQRQLEFDLVLAPGADPSLVSLSFAGARGLALADSGDLTLQVEGGDLSLRSPVVYQDDGNGGRRSVAAHYSISTHDLVSIQLDTYDASLPLIIDPVISYSTFVGGAQADYGFGIAVDSTGSAYITGQTSTLFPVTGDAYDPIASGSNDAFISKLNANGTALVYSTYLGGTGPDFGFAIAVDASGNAYVTGRTDSTDFPTTPEVFQGSHGGFIGEFRAPDAYVTKLGPTGSSLAYSTYLGGTNDDRGWAIAVGSDGSAHVTGQTSSTNFPTTDESAFRGGVSDAFVTKLDPSGSSAVYSRYLGGSGPPPEEPAANPRRGDVGQGIAVDSGGDAYLTGTTDSSDFPTTENAVFRTHQSVVGAEASGYADAFVTKFTGAGSLIYSTFLGGARVEVGQAIAVDASGNAYVTGGTASLASIPPAFPTTTGAYDSTYNFGLDAFVSKLNAAGSALLYSTYFGGTEGSQRDLGLGIAVSGAGRAWVMGVTQSSTLPTVSPTQATYGGGGDAFVAHFDTAASGSGSLLFSTYLGGSGFEEEIGGIAVGPSGDAYVVGATGSSNFPTSAGSYDTTTNGSADTFVVRIGSIVPQGRVAYVYTTDTASRDAFSTFLTSRGFTVDPVTVSAAATHDFSVYRAIVIGPETGSLNTWGTPAAVSRLVAANKPIVGVGEGGYAFFGRKFNGTSGTIGWGNGAHGTGATSVVVANAAAPIWSSPNAVSNPSGGTIALYAVGTEFVAIYDAVPVAGRIRVGRSPGDSNYYPLMSQGCDLLWGFNSSSATMTSAGLDLFHNALITSPCVALSDARGTAQSRETPDGTTIIGVTLGGAVVTLIAPDGTKQRKIAAADGSYVFTDLLGNTTYVVGYDGTVAGRHYVTGVRFKTDPRGNADIPAPQAVFNRKNHTWVTPFTLTDNLPVADQVWRRGQATWYRFAISPQTSVTIELTGCAFNCDLVVYKDLKQVKAKLEADAQTQTGLRLSAQGDIFADDLDADDLDADDLDADDLDADDLDADDLDADDLDADDLDADDLDADDLDADDLDADDLDADDLDADDLDADDLDADDLDADDLDADDLDADDLDADGDGLTGYGTTYVAVQRKGLRAASLTPGLAPETVVFNTRDLTGSLYVRVAGGSSLTGVFSVKARRTADVSCATAPLVAWNSTVLPVPPAVSRMPSTTFGTAVAGKRSLILTDTLAYGLTGADKTAFLDKLAAFAAHPTVQGHVVDLANDTGVQQLRADWALARLCVAQANVVTDAIREVVRRFRTAPGASFEYLINVGGDAVIPFRRVADWAEISRESKYSPPLNALSASEASLVSNTFLSDDFYVGSAIEGSNRTLYLPDVATGRLVESVADVTAYINMYLAAGGVAAPTRALSSGYDFNLDLAAYVTAGLGARGLTVDSSLVSNTWTSAAWRDAVLKGPAANAFGILSLQGHFSANRLVPADNGQRVLATEIAAVTDGRFMSALVYSLGCHSGYSIVNADGSIFTQPLAFPEAFVGKGATLVGGTGYQYGETELMKNTEALMALLTDELGYRAPPSGSAYVNGVPIGKALIYAKRAYMAQTATPRGIDLKVVNVSTVYGSPTMAFQLPNTRARPSVGTVAPQPVTGFAGLSALDVSPSFSLTRTPLVGDPAYYSAGGATTTAPYRPIAPLVTVPTGATGNVLQGAVFLGGAYTEGAFVPRLSTPATELAGEVPRYANDVFMPVLPVKTNLFDGDAVQIVPFQYRSNALGTSGTARVYSDVSVRGYWSSRTGIATAADAPVIRDVSVKVEGGQLVVIATVRGLTDPGIAEVYVTYTNTSVPSRSFGSLAMTEIPLTTMSDGPGLPGFTRLYTATLTGTPSALRFLVQAVSGNGRVAAATSNGQLYGMPSSDLPAIDTRVASAIALSAPAAAIYRSSVTASATLTAGGLALPNKSVRFKLGGSSRLATTNASGVATATLDVNVTPRVEPYALTAAFAGDATAFGSGASTNVRVGRVPTMLETILASPQYSDSAAVARLTANGLSLNEQPVVISRGGVQVATFTDFAGEVRFDTMDFGAGAGPSALTITYPGNARYAETSTTVTVPVQQESATLMLAQDPQPTGLVTITATVLQQPDGSLGDLTRASVAFTVTTEAGAPVVSETVQASATGAASLTRTLPVGLYRVTAELVSNIFFVADSIATTLPVYDPAMFVSGGGWVPTGPTPIGVPANSKGHFAFIAKYLSDNVTPSVSLNVHVKSATGKDNDTDAQAQANGSLKFKETTSDFLLIAGNGAAFTGTGTVNGVAGYRYRADVVDGAPDVFVLHIWNPTLPAAAGGSYLNPKHVVRGDVGGGNIRIHR